MKRSLPPILCTGFPAWEGDYQKSTVQLMRAMAEHQDVLYVEFPFSWKDVWQGWKTGKKPHKRILGLEPRLRKMETEGSGTLHILTLPPIFPVNGLSEGNLYEKIAEYNAIKSARSINKALKSLGFTSPLLINAFNPFLGVYLHGKLPVSAEYYYCYDQIGAAKWTNKHGPRLEKRYLKQVDGLITSSQPLLDEKLADDQAGIVVKNGVNLQIFEQAFLPDPGNIGGTVLGYLGSIDDRLDLEMLFNVLDQWEDARLLMVGRIMEPEIEARLRAHPRVEVTGAQQPESLPQWVKRMDIGLIPFVTNEFTKYIYPLKINEYLAAGLPVVSTSFSDLSDFEEVIYRGDTPESFLAACQQAVKEDVRESRFQRQEFARTHRWEARAEQLTNWLINQSDEMSGEDKINLA